VWHKEALNGDDRAHLRAGHELKDAGDGAVECNRCHRLWPSVDAANEAEPCDPSQRDAYQQRVREKITAALATIEHEPGIPDDELDLGDILGT
jgi:hypothetical protein